MLNQSADHALRAVLFVAGHHEGQPCSAAAIAQALGVPRNYLGKVLHALSSAHVLTSTRGLHGGFRLAAGSDVLTLADVIAPFQRLPRRQLCLLGNRPCDAANPCGTHGRWQGMADQVTAFFGATTIADLLQGEDVQHYGSAAAPQQ